MTAGHESWPWRAGAWCYNSRMHDLGPEDVRRLAAALSISLDGEDAMEIAHRLNAFLDALGALDGLPLDRVEPWPTSPEGAV